MLTSPPRFALEMSPERLAVLTKSASAGLDTYPAVPSPATVDVILEATIVP